VYHVPSFGQHGKRSKTDSLLAVNSQYPKADTIKYKLYLSIGNSYRQTDVNRSVEWLTKAVALSKQLNYSKGLQQANNSLGISQATLGNYEEAIDAFKQSKDAAVVNKDSIALAWCYNNIGNIYIEKTAYKTTLLYYDSALYIRKLLNDSLAIAQSLNNFGFVYKDLGDYTNALLKLFQSAKYLEKIKDVESLAHCYNFIGSIYVLRKNHEYSSLFYKKALVLYRQMNDRSGEAVCLHVIGANDYALGEKSRGKELMHAAYNIYSELNDVRQLANISSDLSELYVSENKFDSAEILSQKAIAYHLQAGITRNLGASYIKLALAQEKLGKLKEAIVSGNKAYETTKNTGEINSLKKITQALSRLYSISGNYAKAYKFALIHDQLKDSLINEATEKAIAQMQVKYETEKKDIEIEKQALQIRKKRTQLVFAVFSIAAILVIVLLLYIRYRLKQKALLSAMLLEEQNARNKAIIEAEEKERVRIARELHDGIGQQLSAAKMNLSAFEQKISAEEKAGFNIVVQLVDDAVKEIRSVSHNMMPNALIKQGLTSAIRDFINKMQPASGLKISLEIYGMEDRLESTTETVLYRILQECVNNIIKHADASVVSIQLVKHDNALSVLIEDNGKGFDHKKVNQFEGIGLKNIISRVQFLNGTVDFDSTIGKGTTVNIYIPV
ncbi:MAG: sensor histidine kinase, partial [Bacteroidota bacterium]